jgi:hypothetical protein
MDSSRSIRSCSRARTTERGFALALALIIAVLYFGLIELMLYDASRELAEARRFRARIIALTLAENGAELASLNIAVAKAGTADAEASDWQGTIKGKRRKNSEGKFTIEATGHATGVVEVRSTVDVHGIVEKGKVRIDYTFHSQ